MKEKKYIKLIRHNAHLAKAILSENTEYAKNKKIISKLFRNNNGYSKDDLLRARLMIIDVLYSTNVNGKKYFGISDIIQFIKNDDDLTLKNKFLSCVKTVESFDKTLFPLNIGINKYGKDGGRANSLITKYGYFLTEYRFPIYDSLAKTSLKIISHRFKLKPFSPSTDIQIFITALLSFKDKLEIDFDTLDNFLWLFGKINKGSFSILFEKKNKYKLFCKELNLRKNSNIKNRLKNEIINGNNRIRKTMGSKLFQFVKFVYEI